jgi:acetylornithine deacetylase/succinyl-diaminopimelate desuccinylase-like protein
MSETVGQDLDQIISWGLETAQRLCSRPSIAAQDVGIEETAQLVRTLLEETGFATHVLRPSSGAPVVYGELKGTAPFTLLLYNHYDVQPAEPLDLWHSSPFEPTIRNGKLYARGISDNKGEIATRLAALRALIGSEGASPITIRWILEGEEEVGSPHFGEIAEAYGDLFRADGALWEGSGATPTGQPGLCLGVKGMLYVELSVRMLSQDAHSGMAPILPSAAWRLIRALNTLRDPDGSIAIPGFYVDIRSPTQAESEALLRAPDMSDTTRELFGIESFVDDLAGVALRKRTSFGPTCNIAGLWSGYTSEGVKTVLPAQASTKLDFRLVPNQDPDRVLAALRGYLNVEGFSDVNIDLLGSAAPVVTPIDSPFVQRVIRIATSHYGQEPIIQPISGGSLPLLDDLQRHVDIPGLFAPGNPGYWGSGAHAPNEHIRVEDFGAAVRFLIDLFRSLAT